MNKVIKIILLLLGCMLYSLLDYRQTYAQQNHFIYIQADDKQPFKININGKTYNSSSIGYIIIPKLVDGKYQIIVDFPDNKYPEQQFSCRVNKTDAGYALKNFGDKGWGLFNLQTLEITMAGSNVTDTLQAVPQRNAFGDMLSDVVNDSSLKAPATQISVSESKKQQPVLKDTANQQSIMQPGNVSGVAAETINNPILKIFERTTDQGANMIFVDTSSGGNDTVKIFLPFQQVPQNNIEDSSVAVKTRQDSAIIMNNQNIQPTSNSANISDTTSSSEAWVKNPFFSTKQKADSLKETIVTDSNSINQNAKSEKRINGDCSI